MEQYSSIQQLLKKEEGQKNRKPVFPSTVIQAVFDGKTGASLEAILAQFNSIYVQYQGNPKDTRNIIPEHMRRAGLAITYMNMESETITERASSAAQKDNDHWGLDTNWSRVDELSLSGDISVSANGTWIINGQDTGVKALGPKGDAGLTPWLKTIDNCLHFSYDGIIWEPCSENIAAWFRWNDNKIQISRDNKTWTDLTGKFADNLFIKGYVATTSALPSGAAQGDIYGVGPTYSADDTAHTNPIYRYYVRNANKWVDNGSFTSISAGVVQEIGDSETEVMSQKAVSTKLSELGSKFNSYSGYVDIIQDTIYSYSSDVTNGKFVASSTYDCVVVRVLQGSSYIRVKNAVASHYLFFATESVGNERIPTSDATINTIPNGAKWCVINLKKGNNPNGLADLKVLQEGEGATIEDVQSTAIRAINSFVIDINHYINRTSGEYLTSKDYNSLWICVGRDVSALEIVGAQAARFHQYNNIEAKEEYLVGRNTSGTIISNDVRLVVVTLESQDIESLGAVMVKIHHKGNSLMLTRNFHVEYNHILSIEGSTYKYTTNTEWDSIWVNLSDNVNQIELVGATHSYIGYFKGAEITEDNYLGYNKTGKVLKEATFCVIDIKKTEPYFDYSKVTVIQHQDFVDGQRFEKLFSPYIENKPLGKNLIDANDLLEGYILDGGQVKPSSKGILSNKIRLENGKYYTAQGIYYYGTKNKIYLVCYDKNDNYIGSISQVATIVDGDTSHTGSATFMFDSRGGLIDYVRVVLQASTTYPFNPDIAQMEEGDEATDFEQYIGEEVVNINKDEVNTSVKKKIRLLSIGNSYSQDVLSYVPFILQNMGVYVDIQIGILMQSSSSLSMHVDNFNNEDAVYYLYLYSDSVAWKNLGLKSIQQALDDYQWDIVCLQQSSQTAFTWEKYQPYCNQLINLVSNYVQYPIQFMWYQPMARPAKTNSGANWSDEEITEHYENTAMASKRLMEETVLQILVPCGTAIQNARTIPSLKQMGDYANNPENTSGLGYLTPDDGVHHQEGLPCQIGAYTFVLKLLEYYGFGEYSILGETTRVTEEWASGKAIPSPHGNYIGSTDENCIMAQKCAIMAVKNPYQVTDMIELGIV